MYLKKSEDSYTLYERQLKSCFENTISVIIVKLMECVRQYVTQRVQQQLKYEKKNWNKKKKLQIYIFCILLMPYCC